MEDTLVKRLNGSEGWLGFRLGSPSVALPDILAVNNGSKSLIIIEAKSGTGTTLQVPAEQVTRCRRWTEALGAYRDRRAVFAFKFLSKKRTGTGTYTGRRLREFYKEWTSRTSRSRASARTTGRRTRSRAGKSRRSACATLTCRSPLGGPAAHPNFEIPTSCRRPVTTGYVLINCELGARRRS